jgi:hypothetical protein
MSKNMIEYRPGRYVNPKRIISANVFKKDEIDNNGIPTGKTVIRVAFDLDVKDINKSVVYSDSFPTVQAAHNYILDFPVDFE